MNIIKNIIITLIFSLLYIACEKKTSTPNNNDECTNCVYNNFCVDSTNFEITDLEELLGTWRFKGFVNDECSLEVAPSTELDSIFISFADNNEIKGFILPNVFEGKYRINDTQILLSDILSTEINEPAWSKRFRQAFVNSLNFDINDEYLYTLTTNDILLFDKTNDIQINICTSCLYETVCLDTTSYKNINQSNLIEEWTLIKYVNLPECSIEEKPDYLNRTVEIIFSENNYIMGSTPSNTFTGDFSLIENKISINNIVSTEVNETDWGNKFWDSILFQSNYVSILDDFLIIHASNRVLIFNKK